MTGFNFAALLEPNTAIDETIQAYVLAAIKAEHDLIESDLLSLPGVHPEMTAERALALELQIIYQRSPDHDGGGSPREYRGIAQGRRMVVDHHPDWGPLNLAWCRTCLGIGWEEEVDPQTMYDSEPVRCPDCWGSGDYKGSLSEGYDENHPDTQEGNA